MGSKTQTTPAALATTKSSLFDIEVGWIPLLDARIEAETDPELSSERPVCLTCSGRADLGDGIQQMPCPSCDGTGRSKSQRELAIEAADVALAEHSEKELQKADSYIGLIRYLERAAAARRADAQHQARIAGLLEGMLAQVKATGANAMATVGRKRIDGERGYLMMKGNGGVAPLLIPDPSLVPDEFSKLEGWVNAGAWARMMAICRRNMMDPTWEPVARWTARVPDNTAIRARLNMACETCAGTGKVVVNTPSKMSAAALESGAESEEIGCATCGGSGKQAVPGAALGERGVHLEVK
jgi:hypothetical protein